MLSTVSNAASAAKIYANITVRGYPLWITPNLLYMYITSHLLQLAYIPIRGNELGAEDDHLSLHT